MLLLYPLGIKKHLHGFFVNRDKGTEIGDSALLINLRDVLVNCGKSINLFFEATVRF